MTINFNTSKDELDLISKVAARAEHFFKDPTNSYPRADLIMDLTACHCNGCPLDFVKLLAFPDFDFLHDITGIYLHIDRTTGQLDSCFTPSCSK